MSDLFGRRALVEVGHRGAKGLRVDSRSNVDLDREGVRLAFDVEKTIHSSANTATIRMYNLSPTNASQVVGLPDAQDGFARISAGYGDELEMIYEGDITKAWTARAGGDVITTVECGDGVILFAAQSVNKTFPAGTAVKDVVFAVAKQFTEAYPDYKAKPVTFDHQPKQKKASRLSLQRLTTDLARLERDLREQGMATELRRALSVTGNGREVMDELARMWRFFWSVQDGSLQVVSYGAVADEAVRLSKDSGLLDLPTPTKSGVQVRALLIPKIRPGVALILESRDLNGQYRVETVKISGDTRGGEWTVDAEARSL